MALPTGTPLCQSASCILRPVITSSGLRAEEIAFRNMTSWFGRRQPPTPTAPEADHAAAPAAGVPLELIKFDQQTGKFELGQQALAVLKRTRGPVGVVAVCGRARQVRHSCCAGGGTAGTSRLQQLAGVLKVHQKDRHHHTAV